MIIDRCPSTLAQGYETYSPIARKRLFGNQVVQPVIPYDSIFDNAEDFKLFLENSERISLSGVQSKYSMVIREGKLELSHANEQGTYLLKPKLTQFQNREFSAANEHLTMQIAEQVFKIETAANALCFFRTGESAYLTKRFDIAPDGTKFRKEDFASLAGLTSDNAGQHYKYTLSYEDVADLLKKFVPAWRVEILSFFNRTVFNFLICNGDAHLKNFSVLETPNGDFRLSPAYDLINTKLHVDDRIFALDKGLFKNGQQAESAPVTGQTFLQWGTQIGLPEKTVKRELERFCATYEKLELLVANSFLSEELKTQYRQQYQGRRDSFLKV